MTDTKVDTLMAQTRRPGVLAAHSLDEFVFSVPDLAVAKNFYTQFGLNVVEEAVNGSPYLSIYAVNNPHRYFRVTQSDKKRLQWLTFGIYADDLPAFEKHLSAMGVPKVSSPDPLNPGGLWVQASDGFAVHVKVAAKSSPSAPPPRSFPPASNGFGRAPSTSSVKKVYPLYMSHMLMLTKDFDKAFDFFCKGMGLRVSDSSGGNIIAFMHSPHGSDHHMLAMLQSDDYGFHHCSWTVDSMDQVGFGMKQMAQAGFAYGWGVGRHVLGSNYFRYVRDPWGSYAEYSFDIDFVPSTVDWPSKDHPPEDSLYVWGPDVPEGFGTNFETQAFAG